MLKRSDTLKCLAAASLVGAVTQSAAAADEYEYLFGQAWQNPFALACKYLT